MKDKIYFIQYYNRSYTNNILSTYNNYNFTSKGRSVSLNYVLQNILIKRIK